MGQFRDFVEFDNGPSGGKVIFAFTAFNTSMRTILLLLLLPAFSAVSWSHEYFFAFAEMDYNKADRCFEITLEGSAHDVEDVMNETGIAIKELEDHYTDAVMLAKIEAFINNGFTLASGGKTTSLKLMGMEVKTNGMVYFYLRSEVIELTSKLDVRFDWLMDALPQQQNKITIRIGEQKYTAVFLPGKRTETLEF